MKRSLGPKTLAYPAPVWLVGTYNKKGRANAMTAAWGGICCSVPPCVYVSLQRARYSYNNILEKKAYTINIPSESQVKLVDYFGMVSGKTVDKFAKTGLTPVRGSVVDAPYIEEFPLIIECKLIQIIDLGIHVQFIGEIQDVKVEDDLVNAEGVPDIEQLKPIIFGPVIRHYYGLGKFLGKAFSIGKQLKEE